MEPNNIFFIDPRNKVFSGALRKQFPLAAVGAPTASMQGWVASEHFNFFSTIPPTYNKSVVLKTVPFMMEEYLIEPLDMYHFTLILAGRGKPVSAYAATNHKMEEWKQLLDSINISPIAIFPDVLALPYEEKHIYAYVSKSRSLARTGEFTGFCGKGEMFFSLLEKQAEDSGRTIKVYTDNSSSVPDELKKNIETKGINWLDFLQHSPLPAKNCNLLHGEHKIKSDKVSSSSLVMRAAVVVLLLSSLIFANDLTKIISYKQQTTDIEDITKTLYSQMFQQNLGDISQMRNRVLVNIQDATVDTEVSSDVWIKLRQLSDVMHSCQDCNILTLRLSQGSKRAEIIFESRQEKPAYGNILTERGWKILAWTTEQVPTQAGFYQVYRSRLVVEKS